MQTATEAQHSSSGSSSRRTYIQLKPHFQRRCSTQAHQRVALRFHLLPQLPHARPLSLERARQQRLDLRAQGLHGISAKQKKYKKNKARRLININCAAPSKDSIPSPLCNGRRREEKISQIKGHTHSNTFVVGKHENFHSLHDPTRRSTPDHQRTLHVVFRADCAPPSMTMSMRTPVRARTWNDRLARHNIT